MTAKQFRSARTSQWNYLGQHENASSQTNCTLQNFYAYRLARLAHSLGVPCALLTNFPEYLGLEGQQLEVLRDAFHARAVFRKDEAGMAACASWVRQELGLNHKESTTSGGETP